MSFICIDWFACPSPKVTECIKYRVDDSQIQSSNLLFIFIDMNFEIHVIYPKLHLFCLFDIYALITLTYCHIFHNSLFNNFALILETFIWYTNIRFGRHLLGALACTIWTASYHYMLNGTLNCLSINIYNFQRTKILQIQCFLNVSSNSKENWWRTLEIWEKYTQNDFKYLIYLSLKIFKKKKPLPTYWPVKILRWKWNPTYIFFGL